MVNKIQYLVKIADFEGPMDLLYQLIMKMEVDIYNISIADVANQYLLYVQEMRNMELDNASEYLVMAAKLLVLKSKRLLPYSELAFDDEELLVADDDEEYALDDLVQQLLEYRRFLTALPQLREFERRRSKLYEKEVSKFIEAYEHEEVQALFSPADLVQAFEKMLARRDLNEPLVRTFSRQGQSVSERMGEIIAKLKKETKSFVSLSALCQNHLRPLVVTTFLSILELLKKREISVWQDDYLSEIYIKLEEES